MAPKLLIFPGKTFVGNDLPRCVLCYNTASGKIKELPKTAGGKETFNLLKSMTGFGQGEVLAHGKRITVEMRAVNHRFGEVVVRLPRAYGVLEERLRRLVLEHVARGRVDVFVNVVREGDKRSLVKVDKELAIAYYNSLRELGELLGISAKIGLEELLRCPEVIVLQEEEEQIEEVWIPLKEAAQQALERLLEMREREGTCLEEDILRRIDQVEAWVEKIRSREPAVVEAYRQRLMARLEELLPGGIVDEARLVQEVAVFAERSNITEEIVRAKSHLEQLRSTVKSAAGPAGRRMDFLLQEINREVNTISSKANDALISQWVVEVKGELEKIREQVQNIE